MMQTCPNCFHQYDQELGLCPRCGFFPGDNPQEPYCLSPGTVLNNRYFIGLADHILSWGICYNALDTVEQRQVSVWEFFPRDIAFRTETQIVEKELHQGETFERSKMDFATISKFISNQSLLSFPRVLLSFPENNTEYAVTEAFIARRYHLPAELPKSEAAINAVITPFDPHPSADLESLSQQGAIVNEISPDTLWETESGILTSSFLQSSNCPTGVTF